MTEIQRILDQMDRAFSGDAWHGPSLHQLLDGVSAEQASKHPVRGVHSIWEIVNHIASWHTIVMHRISGEIVEVTPDTDWPRVWEASEVAWKRSLEHLITSRKRLRQAAADLDDSLLDEKPSEHQDSRYILLHGLIQHDLYHAGQIAVIKKALQAHAARAGDA